MKYSLFYRYMLLLLCWWGGKDLAAQLPHQFYDQLYLDEFINPLGFTFDETGRMYVWEKSGQVFIVDSSGNRLPEPLIDIREEVTNWQDHGLISVALHPEFLTNGYFYLLYAVDPYYYEHFGTPGYKADSTLTHKPTIGRITRYQADAIANFTSTTPGSRKILLGESWENGIPILYQYHGLGTLIFGEDGTLLVSSGDATSPAGTDIGGNEYGTMTLRALEKGILSPDQDIGSYRSQYLGNLNGKILRLDAETGDGLPSNPFFDAAAPRSARSRIWALGFRNPYRIALKPGTGAHFPGEGNPGIIMAGDVGNVKWEELNLVSEGGQNFGWPLFEGVWYMDRFWDKETPLNQMARNPLFGEEGCSEEFFTFKALLARPDPEGIPFIPNPCNPSQAISGEAFPMVESLPLACWANARFNPPARSFVPAFDDNNKVIGIEMSSEESPVESESFMGWSSLAGLFYQGDQFPEIYHGKYFAVDFYGWIQVFDLDEDNHLLSVEPFHEESEEIIHLMENPADGSLFYLNLSGEIHKITFGGNPAPVARISADQYFGPGPLTIQFDASASTDNEEIRFYEWDFGDGATSDELAPVHTFVSDDNEPNQFLVKLTVTDRHDANATTKAIISINNTPPVVGITSFQDGDLYPTDKTSLLVLEAFVRDQEFSNDQLTYEWRTFLHHNTHYHPEPSDFSRKTHTLISPLGCDIETYYYSVELKVTDPAGLSSTDRKIIYPDCSPSFIEWNELEGAYLGKGIQLQWSTRLENEIDYFVIQRSPDLFNFREIGRIRSLSNFANGQTYPFFDEQPLNGSNIYRIKAIGKNRAFDYSNMLSLEFPIETATRVYPNPARRSFQVEIEKASSSIVKFALYSPNGQLIWNTTWETQAGALFRQEVGGSFVKQGLYFYHLQNGEHSKTGSIRILE